MKYPYMFLVPFWLRLEYKPGLNLLILFLLVHVLFHLWFFLLYILTNTFSRGLYLHLYSIFVKDHMYRSHWSLINFWVWYVSSYSLFLCMYVHIGILSVCVNNFFVNYYRKLVVQIVVIASAHTTIYSYKMIIVIKANIYWVRISKCDQKLF